MPTTEVPVDVGILTKALEELQAFNRVLITNRRVANCEAWLPLQVNGIMQNLVKACRAIQMVRQLRQLSLLKGTLAHLRVKAYEKGNPGSFVKWQQVTICVRDSEILPTQGSHGGYVVVGSIEKEARADLNIGHGYSWTEGEIEHVGCINMVYAVFEAVEGSRAD
jgi:hypothetical protein